MKSTELKALLVRIADRIAENKQALTDLDAAIGDGDHGINMSKGFGEVVKKLNTLAEPYTVGELFKTTAMALISHVGGASGPLYGTFFMKGGAAINDLDEMDLADFFSFLKAGVEGVKMRGKSEAGEKTMLDVLVPVLICLEECINGNMDTTATMAQLVKKAEEGVAFTKTIKATKGRATYLGERSIGHIDPGAMSSYLMIKEVADFIQNG